ncbi:MAG TPA: hypothetical protein VMU02_03340, partial [bacterium]|nr:hypothetical protein [bacterium]
LAWLDGDRAHAKVITPPDTTVSLGPTDFGGRYETSRTLKVVAVDYGCDTSAVATYTWYVKQPSGRILLVDDLGDEGGRSSDSTTDAFYRGGLDLCQQDYSVLDIDKFGGMLSAFNLSKLFSMFDLVIWYNEPDTGPPKAPYVLHVPSAQQDLETYVENGGHLLMASLWAVGSSGALSDSVWPEILGIDSVVVKDNSTSFDCKHWTIQSDVPPGPDSIQVVGLWGGVDCMLPRPEAAPLYYIPPGTANTPRYTQTVPFYLGLLNSWGTGKAALLTFPLSRSDGNGNATAEYCKLVNLLLQ